MATILLNVKINENDIKQAEQQINKIFNGANASGNGSGVQSATANVNNLQKSVANLLNTLKESKDKYAPEIFNDLEKRVKTTLNSVKSLNKEIGDDKPTKEQQKSLQSLKKQYEQLGAEYATLRVESQKLQKENKLAIPNVDNLRKKYANLLTTIQGQEKYYKKGTFSQLTSDIKGNLDLLKQLDPTSESYAVTVNKLDAELNKLSADFAETKQSATNFHGSLGEIVTGFIKFQAAAMIVMKPLQMVRQAWQDINETLVETEDAVVALRRVAGEAANANELYDLAQRYGQTFENVNDIATNFARAGYSWVETIQATEAALLALNTAELDASQASDGMIAILQQFGYEASDLEGVIDKLNITADNAAVSTDKLLTALQRTGSSAKNANLTLEETVGIVTALSEATGRSGENIGTAVNSLIQFSTKASSLETFEKIGGSVADTVERYRQGGATVLEIWRELSNVIKNSQTAEGVLGEGFTTEEFEALNEELRNSLGEDFAQVTEIYDTASTFRKNYFIALLQNLDQVEESLATMQDAQGYSQKENAQYLDTYTAKVNALQAKWQDIANDEQGLLGFKKLLVDIGSILLDILEPLGGIRTVLIGIGIAAIGAFGPAIVSYIGQMITALKAAAGAAFQTAMGWIAVAGMALSTVIGLVQDYNAEQERQRELAISTWEANEKSANKLEDLYAKYQKLTPADSDYLTVQKDLVQALGDKATALEGLTVGSEEYTKAVENMTEAELELYRVQLAQASFSTKDKLNQVNFSSSNPLIGFTRGVATGQETKDILSLLKENGVGIKTTYSGGADFNYLATTGSALEDYETFSKAKNTLSEEYNRLVREGEFEKANRLLGSRFYSGISNAVTTNQGAIEDYLRTNTAKLLGDYEISTGSKVSTKEEYDKALNFIIEQLGTSDFYDETIKGFLNSLVRFSDVGEGGGGGGTTDRTSLSDVVNKLEEIRDNTEKTKQIEEKQLALQEARNQRTVRVFNAETGQWEMQANEKDIQNAEKDLRETAFDNILGYLSTDEAQTKLDKGEFTLPDWLTEMLSQSTSDDKFNAFMTSMGILSGASSTTPMTSGAVYNNSSNSTTNNTNSYVVNGVPIPQDVAGKYTIVELFEAMNQLS